MGGPQRHLEREQRKARTDLSLGPLCWQRGGEQDRTTEGPGGPMCKESSEH